MELFAGIGTGLTTILEAGLKVKKYIHIDNGIISRRASQYHLQMLLTLYLSNYLLEPFKDALNNFLVMLSL